MAAVTTGAMQGRRSEEDQRAALHQVLCPRCPRSIFCLTCRQPIVYPLYGSSPASRMASSSQSPQGLR
eukprot:3436763-Prorocentrum_lima.AAC.1